MDSRPYVFIENNNITYQTRLRNVIFSNDWLQIDPDGQIVLRGANPMYSGYAWDGCSPKFFFWDVYFGTPDGVVDLTTRKPETYYASLIHDALYQFRHEYKGQVSRKMTDLIFLDEMCRRNFRLSGLYYRVVRLFGWIYWQDIIRKYPWTRYVFLLLFLGLLWLIFSGLDALGRWVFSLL